MYSVYVDIKSPLGSFTLDCILNHNASFLSIVILNAIVHISLPYMHNFTKKAKLFAYCFYIVYINTEKQGNFFPTFTELYKRDEKNQHRN